VHASWQALFRIVARALEGDDKDLVPDLLHETAHVLFGEVCEAVEVEPGGGGQVRPLAEAVLAGEHVLGLHQGDVADSGVGGQAGQVGAHPVGGGGVACEQIRVELLGLVLEVPQGGLEREVADRHRVPSFRECPFVRCDWAGRRRRCGYCGWGWPGAFPRT